ncbi:hypothetical protein EDE11_13540 [Methylomonas methanica]|uniref:Uncharacterized protein n=1 Tax=Methylomonas methanica TaxID=421 RepID=A0ABY2CGS9_METMH|nr:hypothetical protein EDE11_13540 [Methylomonas methanica]
MKFRGEVRRAGPTTLLRQRMLPAVDLKVSFSLKLRTGIREHGGQLTFAI